MSVDQFLNAVLPSQGYRFALNSTGVNGQPDFRPGQRHYNPGETAAIIARATKRTTEGCNAYFAVGGYNGATRNETGQPRRVAADAQWHRCLRLDIDVGPSKDYTDRRTALTALLGLTQQYQLPPPWIVDSGGGYHVYWGFDRDVVLSDWIVMAGRLRTACEQYSLMADHTATMDAARILRLPGTYNNKPAFLASGNPPLVQIIQQGAVSDPEYVIRHLPQASPLLANTSIPASMRGQASPLQANLHEPYFLRGLLSQCPGMAAMVGDGGARAQEPLWKKALDLVNKAEDPEDVKLRVARGISSGHPSFSEEVFQRKWAQVQAQDYHPPRCSMMASAGMPECATCVMRGKISSPLVLGRPSAASTGTQVLQPPPARPADPPAAMPATPAGAAAPAAAPTLALAAAPAAPTQVGVFLMDTSTRVKVVDGRITAHLLIADGYPTQVVSTEPDENGVRKMYNRHMLDYRLLSVERMLDDVGEKSVVVLSFDRGRDGVAQIEFDNRDFAEPKSFFNKLNAKALYCSRKAGADFVDKFMPEFLTSLQRARSASQISGRCGWSDDLNSFVLGTTLYRNNGTQEHIRTSIAPGEMEGYHVNGSEADWKTAFDICLSGGPDRQCVLALAIAGPLMVYTGLDGMLMNAYSPESGVGKSTLCDAAMSIWGSPDVLRKDFRDTANALFKLASVTGNMPMVIDEFTNVEGKALSDWVYTLTQGREKHRLSSDAKLQAAGGQRWCLAAITTANNSVHEKLQMYRPDSAAEAARVFELRLHPLQIDPARMGAVKNQLQELRRSYGFLGPKLVSLFLSKPPQYWRDQVMSRISKWDREASTSAGDRFRSATCALIEIGAALGKAFGFAFDVQGVEQQLRRHWNKQVVEMEAERKRPADYINSYFLRNSSDMMMRSGPDGTQVLNVGNTRRLVGEVKGKTIAGGKWVGDTILIPSDLLREFVREQNGNYKAVSEWLEGANPIVVRHGRLELYHGTSGAVHTHCYELRHEDVAGSSRPALALVTQPPENANAQPQA